MRWPQFESWRLFISVGLVGLAMFCLRQLWQQEDMQPHWGVLGVLLLGAAIGVPAKQIVFCTFYLPIWIAFILLAGFLIYSCF